MLNTYKLAQGPLGRAMILRIAAVCAALHLLCTFPGGVGGMARVMRGEDAIEWSVIHVSGLAMPQCIQEASYIDYIYCCYCGYNYDFYYNCNEGGGVLSYEDGQVMLRARVIIKLLWALNSDDGREALKVRQMSRWDAIWFVLEMSSYTQEKIVLQVELSRGRVDQELHWWGWLDLGREADVVSDENADAYQMYNGYPAGTLEDIYDKLYGYDE
jgi:hypothetical protein